MYKKFPDTIATFSFLPAGVSFGYIFFLPWIDEELYNGVSFWPYFAMLFSIVITASMISIIKLNNGKYIFEHFSYLATASVLFIITGVLFVVLRDEHTHSAVFISAIATGIVYVAGLSYVHIRSEKQERPTRIAVCHAWKLVGFAIVISVYLYLLDDTGQPHETTLTSFYQIIGFVMIGAPAIFICLLLLNELRQRQGLIYNYRDCLDHDNAIANNYCKLFSRHEVIIERNPTVSAAGLWKSTENLLPRNKKNFTNLWTIYLMLPKLHGAVMFQYFLIMFAMASSSGLVDSVTSQGITVWLMALGAIWACFLFPFVHAPKIYTLMSILALASLGVSYVFYKSESNIMAILLWIFFFTVALSCSVPDIALLEVSKIRFCEGALAIGYFIEIVPIAILQSLQSEAYKSVQLYTYTDKYFLPIIISSIVILLITSMIYQLHMPSTKGKSLLQIQNELLKYKKYFALDFDKDINSEAPRRSTESNNYLMNNQVNVFEEHDKNLRGSTTRSVTNDYSEVMDRLPDPPVNNVKNFDYDTEMPKPPVIIPRVNIGNKTRKSAHGSMYENEI